MDEGWAPEMKPTRGRTRSSPISPTPGALLVRRWLILMFVTTDTTMGKGGLYALKGKTVSEPVLPPERWVVDLQGGINLAKLEEEDNTLNVIARMPGGFGLPDNVLDYGAPISLLMTAALRHPLIKTTVNSLADSVDFNVAASSLDIVTACSQRFTGTLTDEM